MNLKTKQRIEQFRRGEVPEGYKKVNFSIIPNSWSIHTISEHLKESRIAGSKGNDAKKITVKLWNKGVVEKKEIHSGSENTQYYTRKQGQFIYSKLDFLNCAFGIVPKELDGYESTLDLPTFDIKGINEKYLLLQVIQKRFYEHWGLMAANGGRKARRISPDDFLSFPIIFPPLPEQHKIADILSTQDKVIELKEQLLAQKQQQKKYLMQQLLTGKKRLPRFSGEWKKEKLGNCSSMYSGGTPNTGNKMYYGNDYIWISIKDMTSAGKYIYSSERGLTEEGFRNCSAKLFSQGTVLFAMYASIGECSIAANECCTSQAILGITPNSSLNNEFLYYWMCNFKTKFKGFGQIGSQPNLNKGIVQSVIIQLPPLEEQNAIADVLSTADREIDLLRQNIEAEKQKKKALMQLLLTGIVRVPV